MTAEISLSTVPASPHFDPGFRSRAIEAFGEDGAWLLLSQLWYGWRTHFDLACRLVGGPSPVDHADRPAPIGDEYRIVVDLQVQAHVYSAAEQFVTLVYAMCRHEPGTQRFFECYVDAPDLPALIDAVADVDHQQLVSLGRGSEQR